MFYFKKDEVSLMQLLQCEVCNGNELIKQDGVFVCQHCGCKYSLEEVKKLLGPSAPIVSGYRNSALETALSNAESLYAIGQFRDSQQAFDKITKEFASDPQSYRAWLGLAKCHAITHREVGDFGIRRIEDYLNLAQKICPTADISKEYHELYSILTDIVISKKSLPNLADCQKLIHRTYTFPVAQFIAAIENHYKVCCQNAQTIKRAVSTPSLINLYEVPGPISDIVAISENDCITHKTHVIFDRRHTIADRIHEAKKQQSYIWKRQGLCELCGGKTSFWSGSCTNCGHRNT